MVSKYENLSIRDLKNLAQLRKKKQKIPLHEAQNEVAREAGFRDWHHAISTLASAEDRTAKPNDIIAPAANPKRRQIDWGVYPWSTIAAVVGPDQDSPEGKKRFQDAMARRRGFRSIATQVIFTVGCILDDWMRAEAAGVEPGTLKPRGMNEPWDQIARRVSEVKDSIRLCCPIDAGEPYPSAVAYFLAAANGAIPEGWAQDYEKPTASKELQAVLAEYPGAREAILRDLSARDERALMKSNPTFAPPTHTPIAKERRRKNMDFAAELVKAESLVAGAGAQDELGIALEVFGEDAFAVAGFRRNRPLFKEGYLRIADEAGSSEEFVCMGGGGSFGSRGNDRREAVASYKIMVGRGVAECLLAAWKAGGSITIESPKFPGHGLTFAFTDEVFVYETTKTIRLGAYLTKIHRPVGG